MSEKSKREFSSDVEKAAYEKEVEALNGIRDAAQNEAAEKAEDDAKWIQERGYGKGKDWFKEGETALSLIEKINAFLNDPKYKDYDINGNREKLEKIKEKLYKGKKYIPYASGVDVYISELRDFGDAEIERKKFTRESSFTDKDALDVIEEGNRDSNFIFNKDATLLEEDLTKDQPLNKNVRIGVKTLQDKRMREFLKSGGGIENIEIEKPDQEPYGAFDIFSRPEKITDREVVDILDSLDSKDSEKAREEIKILGKKLANATGKEKEVIRQQMKDVYERIDRNSRGFDNMLRKETEDSFERKNKKINDLLEDPKSNLTQEQRRELIGQRVNITERSKFVNKDTIDKFEKNLRDTNFAWSGTIKEAWSKLSDDEKKAYIDDQGKESPRVFKEFLENKRLEKVKQLKAAGIDVDLSRDAYYQMVARDLKPQDMEIITVRSDWFKVFKFKDVAVKVPSRNGEANDNIVNVKDFKEYIEVAQDSFGENLRAKIKTELERRADTARQRWLDRKKVVSENILRQSSGLEPEAIEGEDVRGKEFKILEERRALRERKKSGEVLSAYELSKLSAGERSVKREYQEGPVIIDPENVLDTEPTIANETVVSASETKVDGSEANELEAKESSKEISNEDIQKVKESLVLIKTAKRDDSVFGEKVDLVVGNLEKDETQNDAIVLALNILEESKDPSNLEVRRILAEQICNRDLQKEAEKSFSKKDLADETQNVLEENNKNKWEIFPNEFKKKYKLYEDFIKEAGAEDPERAKINGRFDLTVEANAALIDSGYVPQSAVMLFDLSFSGLFGLRGRNKVEIKKVNGQVETWTYDKKEKISDPVERFKDYVNKMTEAFIDRKVAEAKERLEAKFISEEINKASQIDLENKENLYKKLKDPDIPVAPEPTPEPTPTPPVEVKKPVEASKPFERKNKKRINIKKSLVKRTSGKV